MEELSEKNKIVSFKDLWAYQNYYKAMLIVHKDILLKLPKEEKYDLVDQMRRASKAPTALIAEGFAKRYQKRNWMKYLDDTIGEGNEMINHLSICKDIYKTYVDEQICINTISIYDMANRQTYKLKLSWQDFHNR